MRKTKKNLSQDSQSSGEDLNPGPPKYEGVLTTRSLRSAELNIVTSLPSLVFLFLQTNHYNSLKKIY
jgi:hypothetical protein